MPLRNIVKWKSVNPVGVEFIVMLFYNNKCSAAKSNRGMENAKDPGKQKNTAVTVEHWYQGKISELELSYISIHCFVLFKNGH